MNYISNFVNEHCQFNNYYRRTECIGEVIQYLPRNDDGQSLSTGRLLPNVQIYLLDDYLQPVIPGIQIGEIVIGGNI